MASPLGLSTPSLAVMLHYLNTCSFCSCERSLHECGRVPPLVLSTTFNKPAHLHSRATKILVTSAHAKDFSSRVTVFFWSCPQRLIKPAKPIRPLHRLRPSTVTLPTYWEPLLSRATILDYGRLPTLGPLINQPISSHNPLASSNVTLPE